MRHLLRAAVIDDIPAITRVRTSVRENHLSVEEMAARGITPASVAAMIAAGPCCWVALEGETVVGFSMIDQEDGGIFACFVHPDHEGQGHGRALLQVAEAQLFRSHQEIWLETGAATRAAGFYRSLGWGREQPAEGAQIRLAKRRGKALLIIDMQMEMQHRIAAGGEVMHPEASLQIAKIAADFRRAGHPVLHVRHRGQEADSPFQPGRAGFAPMPCAEALAGETIFEKTTSSAFASTGLEAHLRHHGIGELVVCGAVAGFCVNSTVRAAADLGFVVTVARDAVLGFGVRALPAAVVFESTMALLAAGFATVRERTEIVI